MKLKTGLIAFLVTFSTFGVACANESNAIAISKLFKPNTIRLNAYGIGHVEYTCGNCGERWSSNFISGGYVPRPFPKGCRNARLVNGDRHHNWIVTAYEP